MKRVYFQVKSIIRKIIADEVPKEAAALTFVTVLSFIPFLMLLFFIIPDIPGLNLKETLEELFLSILLPDSVEAGSVYITNILDNRAPSNIFNVILLIITSFTLFKFINSTFDKLLNVREIISHNIIYKMSKFIGMIVFGFIFMFILFSSTSLSIITRIFDFPILRNLSFIIIPFTMFFLVNSFIYFFAASIRIHPKSLFIGSVSASVIWIIVKIGFDFYIANLTNMEVVFGVIATLPIFLMWIYLNWVIILLGVIFIHAIEMDDVRLLAIEKAQKLKEKKKKAKHSNLDKPKPKS